MDSDALIGASDRQESHVEIIGKVVEIYGGTRKFTFEYCDSDGSCAKVIVPYGRAIPERLLTELFSGRAERSALLRGTGLFVDGSLMGFERVDSFEMLPLRDVKARIEEIVRLKPGWSGEDGDREFDRDSLRRFASEYASHLEGYDPPYIFPTTEAGLSIEWDGTRTVLEVDSTLTHAVLLGDDVETELDLGTGEGWKVLAGFLSTVNRSGSEKSQPDG